MTRARLPLFLFLLLSCVPALEAQIKVDLKIPRRLFIVYEPIIATVAVTNLTGRDIVLQDKGENRWFSFQVMTADDRPVPPLDLNYQLEPLPIAAGQTVKRSVNLTSLYAIRDFGLHRVRANIYFADLDRYFSSPVDNVDLTEGKLIWQQTVGVPEGKAGAGEYRTLSLLTHRQMKDNMLYARVEDKEGGIVYTTCQLGRVLTAYEPQVLLDEQNQISVLQLVGPKTYLLSRVGVNGEWLGQRTYNEVKTRPHLRKSPAGAVQIVGGQLDVPVMRPEGAPPLPKLSDRPPGFPTR